MIQTVFTPGRTELAGNHPDHQNGRILAGAIDRGITARFEANGEKLFRFSPSYNHYKTLSERFIEDSYNSPCTRGGTP